MRITFCTAGTKNSQKWIVTKDKCGGCKYNHGEKKMGIDLKCEGNSYMYIRDSDLTMVIKY